jgi:methylmalonyl-CoA/ethylmalonyl-CoA epimerase
VRIRISLGCRLYSFSRACDCWNVSFVWSRWEEIAFVRNFFIMCSTWHLTIPEEGVEGCMFTGMDHVGVAVKNLDEALKVYRDVLGFKLEGIHVLTERKVKVAFLSTGGQTQIELLEPLSSDSTIGKFLESRGEGIHHFAVYVKDVEGVLKELKSKGVALIDETPKMGAEGKKIAFVHPKSTKGVLLELVQKP